MEHWDFVDLATKAKELGITEATLRARILSGQDFCFMYASNLNACACDNGWLPPHDIDRFPMVDWEDYGSGFRQSGNDDVLYSPRRHLARDPYWPPSHTPRYCVRGWVAVAEYIAADVLTRSSAVLSYPHVAVCDAGLEPVCWLRVQVQPTEEWVAVDNGEYLDGGYWREIPVTLTPADLFMRATGDTSQRALSSRKEQSYLGIIAAMRALLRDKDGGGFPSEAKIIEQLVERFGSVVGVSKRNLEKVFPDATRAAGDLMREK